MQRNIGNQTRIGMKHNESEDPEASDETPTVEVDRKEIKNVEMLCSI